jgi:hypothetical protein
MPKLLLEDALQLIHLHAERGSPKFEPAARRWLLRYLTEGSSSLERVTHCVWHRGGRALPPGVPSGGFHLPSRRR